MVFPADKYHVRLLDVEEVPKKAEWVEPGQDKYQLKFKFEILQPGPYYGKVLVQYANRSLLKGSKARGWVEGMLGRALLDKEEVIFDNLIGTECTLLLGDKRPKSGEPGNVIMSITRIKRPTPSAASSIEEPIPVAGDTVWNPDEETINAATSDAAINAAYTAQYDERVAKLGEYPAALAKFMAWLSRCGFHSPFEDLDTTAQHEILAKLDSYENIPF